MLSAESAGQTDDKRSAGGVCPAHLPAGEATSTLYQSLFCEFRESLFDRISSQYCVSNSPLKRLGVANYVAFAISVHPRHCTNEHRDLRAEFEVLSFKNCDVGKVRGQQNLRRLDFPEALCLLPADHFQLRLQTRNHSCNFCSQYCCANLCANPAFLSYADVFCPNWQVCSDENTYRGDHRCKQCDNGTQIRLVTANHHRSIRTAVVENFNYRPDDDRHKQNGDNSNKQDRPVSAHGLVHQTIVLISVARVS